VPNTCGVERMTIGNAMLVLLSHYAIGVIPWIIDLGGVEKRRRRILNVLYDATFSVAYLQRYRILCGPSGQRSRH
jgi:hypothetical protein